MGLYSERIEALIDAALVDGEISDKERAVLIKRAKEEGLDLDEFEMVLNAKGFERNTVKQGVIVTREESVPSDHGLGLIGEKVTSAISSLLRPTQQDELISDDIDTHFSIPNTKEALLEFMSSLRPKLRTSERYVDLYEECVIKVKRQFPDDPSFHDYIAGFDNTAADIRTELRKKEEEKKQNTEDKKILILLIILVANGFLGYLLLSLL